MPDLFLSPKALRGLGLLVAGACLWAALGTTPLSGAEPEWVAPARAAKKPNPVAVTPDSLAKGKVIYEKTCLSCHGDGGMGNGPKAKDLDVKPKALAVDAKKIAIPK